MIRLRDYQTDLLRDIRAGYAKGTKAICAVAPTGAGKTLCFAEIAKSAAARGRSVCVVAHRDTLIRQAAEKMDAFGIPYGIIAAGYTGTKDTIQIASVQSLVRRLDRHAFDFLIFDECHLSAAESYRKLCRKWPDAHVLGVTATPVLGNGKGLGDVFQSLVLGPSISKLIADGYLVAPVTYGPIKKVDLSGVKTRAGDYDLADLERVVDTPKITGDALAEIQKVCPRVPTMIFCVSIRHAQEVAAQFNAAGLSAASVDGTMKREDIRDRIAALSDGRIQYLASCDLLGVGFDAPGVTCAVFLRPTMSLGLYVQQGGRALRPVYAPGYDLSTREGRLAAIAASPKPRAILLDHVGNFIRHDLVDTEREWTLEGKKKRAGKGGAVVRLRQCDHCQRPHAPAPRCPFCGHVYAVESKVLDTASGELAPVDRAALHRAKKREEWACDTLEKLQELGKRRGYAPGWAYFRWEHRKSKRPATEQEFFA